MEKNQRALDHIKGLVEKLNESIVKLAKFDYKVLAPGHDY